MSKKNTDDENFRQKVAKLFPSGFSARYVGLTPEGLRNRARTGKIKYYKDGDGNYLFSKEDLDNQFRPPQGKTQ